MTWFVIRQVLCGHTRMSVINITNDSEIVICQALDRGLLFRILMTVNVQNLTKHQNFRYY
jgi:hypothetical protein